jgi:hypothetical protein
MEIAILRMFGCRAPPPLRVGAWDLKFIVVYVEIDILPASNIHKQRTRIVQFLT